jgi:hypothetical protein
MVHLVLQSSGLFIFSRDAKTVKKNLARRPPAIEIAGYNRAKMQRPPAIEIAGYNRAKSACADWMQ